MSTSILAENAHTDYSIEGQLRGKTHGVITEEIPDSIVQTARYGKDTYNAGVRLVKDTLDPNLVNPAQAGKDTITASIAATGAVARLAERRLKEFAKSLTKTVDVPLKGLLDRALYSESPTEILETFATGTGLSFLNNLKDAMVPEVFSSNIRLNADNDLEADFASKDDLLRFAMNTLAEDPQFMSAMRGLDTVQSLLKVVRSFQSVYEFVQRMYKVAEPLMPVMGMVSKLALSGWSGGTTAQEAANDAKVEIAKLTEVSYQDLWKYMRPVIFDIPIKIPAILVGGLDAISDREDYSRFYSQALPQGSPYSDVYNKIDVAFKEGSSINITKWINAQAAEARGEGKTALKALSTTSDIISTTADWATKLYNVTKGRYKGDNALLSVASTYLENLLEDDASASYVFYQSRYNNIAADSYWNHYNDISVGNDTPAANFTALNLLGISLTDDDIISLSKNILNESNGEEDIWYLNNNFFDQLVKSYADDGFKVNLEERTYDESGSLTDTDAGSGARGLFSKINDLISTYQNIFTAITGRQRAYLANDIIPVVDFFVKNESGYSYEYMPTNAADDAEKSIFGGLDFSQTRKSVNMVTPGSKEDTDERALSEIEAAEKQAIYRERSRMLPEAAMGGDIAKWFYGSSITRNNIVTFALGESPQEKELSSNNEILPLNNKITLSKEQAIGLRDALGLASEGTNGRLGGTITVSSSTELAEPGFDIPGLLAGAFCTPVYLNGSEGSLTGKTPDWWRVQDDHNLAQEYEGDRSTYKIGEKYNPAHLLWPAGEIYRNPLRISPYDSELLSTKKEFYYEHRHFDPSKGGWTYEYSKDFTFGKISQFYYIFTSLFDKFKKLSCSDFNVWRAAQPGIITVDSVTRYNDYHDGIQPAYTKREKYHKWSWKKWKRKTGYRNVYVPTVFSNMVSFGRKLATASFTDIESWVNSWWCIKKAGGWEHLWNPFGLPGKIIPSGRAILDLDALNEKFVHYTSISGDNNAFKSTSDIISVFQKSEITRTFKGKEAKNNVKNAKNFLTRAGDPNPYVLSACEWWNDYQRGDNDSRARWNGYCYSLPSPNVVLQVVSPIDLFFNKRDTEESFSKKEDSGKSSYTTITDTSFADPDTIVFYPYALERKGSSGYILPEKIFIASKYDLHLQTYDTGKGTSLANLNDFHDQGLFDDPLVPTFEDLEINGKKARKVHPIEELKNRNWYGCCTFLDEKGNGILYKVKKAMAVGIMKPKYIKFHGKYYNLSDIRWVGSDAGGRIVDKQSPNVADNRIGVPSYVYELEPLDLKPNTIIWKPGYPKTRVNVRSWDKVFDGQISEYEIPEEYKDQIIQNGNFFPLQSDDSYFRLSRDNKIFESYSYVNDQGQAVVDANAQLPYWEIATGSKALIDPFTDPGANESKLPSADVFYLGKRLVAGIPRLNGDFEAYTGSYDAAKIKAIQAAGNKYRELSDEDFIVAYSDQIKSTLGNKSAWKNAMDAANEAFRRANGGFVGKKSRMVVFNYIQGQPGPSFNKIINATNPEKMTNWVRDIISNWPVIETGVPNSKYIGLKDFYRLLTPWEDVATSLQVIEGNITASELKAGHGGTSLFTIPLLDENGSQVASSSVSSGAIKNLINWINYKVKNEGSVGASLKSLADSIWGGGGVNLDIDKCLQLDELLGGYGANSGWIRTKAIDTQDIDEYKWDKENAWKDWGPTQTKKKIWRWGSKYHIVYEGGFKPKNSRTSKGLNKYKVDWAVDENNEPILEKSDAIADTNLAQIGGSGVDTSMRILKSMARFFENMLDGDPNDPAGPYAIKCDSDGKVQGRASSLYFQRFQALSARMNVGRGLAQAATIESNWETTVKLLLSGQSVGVKDIYSSYLTVIPIEKSANLTYIPPNEDDIHKELLSEDSNNINVGYFYDKDTIDAVRSQIHDKCMLTCNPCPVKDYCPFYDEDGLLKDWVPQVKALDLYVKDNKLDLLCYDQDVGGKTLQLYKEPVSYDKNGKIIPKDQISPVVVKEKFIDIHLPYSDIVHGGQERNLEDVRTELKELLPDFVTSISKPDNQTKSQMYYDDMGWLHGARYGSLSLIDVDGLRGAEEETTADVLTGKSVSVVNPKTESSDKKTARNSSLLYDAVYIRDENTYVMYQPSPKPYEVSVDLNEASGNGNEKYRGYVKIQMPIGLKGLSDASANDLVYLVSDDTQDAVGHPISPIVYLGKARNVRYAFDITNDDVKLDEKNRTIIGAADVAQWCVNYAKGLKSTKKDAYWMENIDVPYTTENGISRSFTIPGRSRVTDVIETRSKNIDTNDFLQGKKPFNQYIKFVRKVSFNLQSIIENLKEDKYNKLEKREDRRTHIINDLAKLACMKTNLRLVIVKSNVNLRT